MTELKIRKPYDPSLSVKASIRGTSRTKQAMSKECDINNIMARYAKTGLLTHTNRYAGQYADLGTATDLHEAHNVIIAADAAFSSLPAAVRTRFDNDPEKFLEFVQNPDNLDEINSLGLGVPFSREILAEATKEIENETLEDTPDPGTEQ